MTKPNVNAIDVLLLLTEKQNDVVHEMAKEVGIQKAVQAMVDWIRVMGPADQISKLKELFENGPSYRRHEE